MSFAKIAGLSNLVARGHHPQVGTRRRVQATAAGDKPARYGRRSCARGTQRHSILGCPVDAVTMDEALLWIGRFVDSGGTHQIVTLNPEFIMRARRHRTFASVLRNADLATPDGVGLIFAARLLGFRLPGRVTGIDLVRRLAHVAAVRGWRMYLLGASPGVAERAAAALQAENPGLLIAGTCAGSPRDDDADDICRSIRDSRAQIVLVAFGAPAQELWIARHLANTQAPVAIGVGGAFDFLAGVRGRAPAWMRRTGLEWAYRLLQEPWRWRRMVALPAFAAHVAREALRLRRSL